MSDYQQIFRQYPAQPALHVRPPEDGVLLWLDADAGELARAATLSAALRVPVDVAITLSYEALNCSSEHALRAVLERILFESVSGAPPEHLKGWVHQLRWGSRWVEDQLPAILAPADLAEDLGRRPGEAVRLAGDPQYLPLVFAAEAAANTSRGSGLGELLRDDGFAAAGPTRYGKR
jgi:hypothetical protein